MFFGMWLVTCVVPQLLTKKFSVPSIIYSGNKSCYFLFYQLDSLLVKGLII